MTPNQFVEIFHNEKTDYLNMCFDKTSDIFVSKKIALLNLSEDQKTILREIVDGILIDTYYTILLGLDGCANIGGLQRDYKIYDEDGSLITDGGEIEGHAWEYFQNEE